MGRILSLVLGLAVTAFLAYRVVYGRQGAGGDGASAPKQQLENVRNATKEIEAQQEERLKAIADMPNER